MIASGNGYRIGSRRSQVNAGIQRPAYNYWTLVLEYINGGGGQASMAEVAFFDELGQRINPSAWNASSTSGGNPPYVLGDNNTSTVWESDNTYTQHSVSASFSGPVKVSSIKITAGSIYKAPTTIALYGGDYHGHRKDLIGRQNCSWSYSGQVNTLTYY